jgi:hypothetical protein
MATKQALKLLFVAAITLIGLNLAPAFAATPGTWVGTAEFGTFDLVVNAQGTGIEKITYHFSAFTCGPVTISGGIGITPGTAWPISSGEFSITNTLDPPNNTQEMTVSGSFETATYAAGTWKAVFNGEQCTGTWETSGGGGDDDLTVDHSYVQGVYWNPEDLPGWGFFVDIQEDTMFGAIYGYKGSDSTFITLQGTRRSTDGLTYQGNVFFVTNGGSSTSDVGNFTWIVGDHEASPAALLTISSNILNVTNLGLVRFRYAEKDKVDMLTGTDWNIVRRVSGATFGDYYAITDTRMVENGITFAEVVDNADANNTGVTGYFPMDEDDLYAMLVEYDSNTDVFYLFLGTNTDMYGRYWLVDEGDEPTGEGSHFRAAVDTWQAVDTTKSGTGGITAKPGDTLQSISNSDFTTNAVMPSARKDLEELEYDNVDAELEPMFSEASIKFAFGKLAQASQSINK